MESVIFTASADDVMENRFSFYGETHSLPDAIDWEHNPGTAHWIVDLNRFPFLETLCGAWRRTGEDRYARKCVDLILSWIAQSHDMEAPSERVMCRSYLNVAIHLIYWVKALEEIEARLPGMISEGEMEMIARSIGRQLVWLDRKIPTHTTNWVFIGCRGMLVTLAHFPHAAGRTALAARAWARIAEAMRAQVLPDGIHEEMAIHYHAVVASHVIMCLDHHPMLPPAGEIGDIEGILRKMLRFLEHTVTPDGFHLAFGDSDADYGPRVVQLLGHPIARRLLGGAPALLKSRCFPHAGTFFLREGSGRGSKELYLAFDGGSFGTGHAHEDKLSFWLSALGRSFIVDPGRHLYDQSEISFRSFLSSTTAHSTIMIDGCGQNCRALRGEPGVWRRGGEQPLFWDEKPDGSATAGAFYDHGYGPDHIDVVHYRMIFFFPDLGGWSIVDVVEGEGDHQVESRLQFAPGELVCGEGMLQTAFPAANLAVKYRRQDWDSVRIECGRESPRGGWYSIGYNRLEPAPCAVFSREAARLPMAACFSLVPFEAGDPWIGKAAEAERRALSRYPAVLECLKKTRDRASAGPTK